MCAKEIKKSSEAKSKDQRHEEVETTGHSWDGIEELNNPLPRWWLWTFYACIAFALLWSILYPSWPLIHGATQGLLGYDSRERVQEKIDEYQALNADLDNRIVAASYEDIAGDEELLTYATHAGEVIFETYCSQCHGIGAAGSPGYPNLTDDDWLWGGTYADIDYTVHHGIRDYSDDATRDSAMTPFAGVLTNEEIETLVSYVQSLSSIETPEFDLAAAETLFANNCASCHGENAMGDRAQGAPNLTDAIWLFGGDRATIRETIMKGRGSMMPQWGVRLDEAQIKQVVTYVHGRGGGE